MCNDTNRHAQQYKNNLGRRNSFSDVVDLL